MEDDVITLGWEWEENAMRRALEQLGDKEALRIFDEEQEKARIEAEKEVAEMERDGMILKEDN